MKKYLQRFHSCFSNAYKNQYEEELPIKFLILAMNFIDRFMEMNPNFKLTNLNGHRLVCAAILEANKILVDDPFPNEFFATVAGVNLELLNKLEGDFCNKIKFNFKMDHVEFAAKAKSLGLNEEQVAKILAIDVNGMSPSVAPKEQPLTTNSTEQSPENSIKKLIFSCLDACFSRKGANTKPVDDEQQSSGKTTSVSSSKRSNTPD